MTRTGAPLDESELMALPEGERQRWLEQWFNDPNTSALSDELGRWFRSQPAEVQLPELREQAERLRAMLGELPEEGSNDSRIAVAHLREGLESHLETCTRRIAELEGGEGV